jgi:hypothetical protein
MHCWLAYQVGWFLQNTRSKMAFYYFSLMCRFSKFWEIVLFSRFGAGFRADTFPTRDSMKIHWFLHGNLGNIATY